MPKPTSALSSASSLSARFRAVKDTGARHTRRVNALKLGLPILAGLLLLAALLWPKFSERASSETAAALQQAALTVVLATPRFSGIDAAGRPYSLTADKATQLSRGQGISSAGRIALEKPQAEITLSDGHWLSGRAGHGIYDYDAESLELSGGLELFRDDGIQFMTEAASIDLKTRAAKGDKPARLQGAFGTVEGTGFEITPEADRVIFRGPARARLIPAKAS